MVLLGPPLDPMPPTAPRSIKPVVVRDLTKLDILRHGCGGWTRLGYRQRRPMPPPTDKQRACREPMRFARKKYFEENLDNIAIWNANHPVDYFCEAVKRWLAGHSPASSCLYPLDGASEITVTAAAAYTAFGIMLTFTPSDWYALWGIAILRAVEPIETPDVWSLRYIYPQNRQVEATWIDADKKSGTYHYRLCACEITGRIGPYCADVFATVP